jgi:Domain of unknown function (DUF4410)
MNHITRIAVPVLAAALAACGTTGDIQPEHRTATALTAPAEKGKPAVDLSGYDRVVVLDFVDATDKGKLKPDEVRAYTDQMATAVHTFPDIIAAKIRDTGAFQEVIRGQSQGKALVISGRITRLEEGSGALRFWVGMGAGSSYFDATTDLSDAASGETLGHVVTDKNSWALGGAIAATQTVQSFMQGAAQKIAAQLRDGKRGQSVASTH